MPDQEAHPFTKPFYVFFLVFPSGIAQGFVTVALPYFLVNSGFSVAQAAGIVAIGFSANLWRFIWGPVVDLSLSLKRWYWIGLLVSTLGLLLLCITPFDVKQAAWLSMIVFLSQVAATFLLLPITGIMAHCIEPQQKGKAAGWYQAGNLAGTGFGGGVGLWLTNHYSIIVAGVVLSVIALGFALVILLIKDVQHSKQGSLLIAIKNMGKDVLTMVKIPVVLFVIVLILLPIGSGAAANLWSAIGKDWKVNADTVALITGILSGVVSAVGCVIGGHLADRKGVWFAYMFSGSACAAITLIMAAMPYQPVVYIVGVLAYTFGIGLVYAAFSAVLLYASGRRNAATKYSLLSSIGNVSSVYMTVIDGRMHDNYNSKHMLVIEALLGFAFVLICLMILYKLKQRNLLLPVVE